MTSSMAALRGVPAAPGVARGPWAAVGRAPLPPTRAITADEAAGEIARVRTAVRTTAVELEMLAADVRAAGHDAEAAIFTAQAAMALDPALLDDATERISNERIDAVAAVQAAAASIASLLAGLGDELLRARAADVLDVGDRVARHLAGVPLEATLTAPAIVVADDLAPSVTATLPRDRLLGIVLAGSSPTAHAAILARAYGIPAVVGATDIVAAVRSAGPTATIALDGATGEVVIDPDAPTAARFDGLASAARADRERDRREATEPARTLDGTEITLLANIGTPEESAAAVDLGARGVGLFRTEFLFLERTSPPTEDEQVAAYRSVVEAFAGAPVTIRLLDVGGDKAIPYLPIATEDNPFLGVRALRLAEDRPELFVTQLRACYRAAAAGPVKVMAPMVADAGDAARLLALAARAHEEVVAAGQPLGDVALGVMLEIPSAILTAGTYFSTLAFASLGTNDLLQYALAVDRGNPALERYRDPLHPAVLRLVRESVEAARTAGIDLSVCGEMAGDPTAALALVGLGIRSLSMSAPSLAAVRRALRGASVADLEALAAAALADPSAAAVRARFGPSA